MFGRIAVVVATLLLTPGTAPAQENPGLVMENFLFGRLDQWVAGGGDLATIREEVVASCAQLAVLIATPEERALFADLDREEYDLRVDVCTKMTMHRVSPQPEFARQDVLPLICDRGQPMLTRVCQRSGFR